MLWGLSLGHRGEWPASRLAGACFVCLEEVVQGLDLLIRHFPVEEGIVVAPLPRGWLGARVREAQPLHGDHFSPLGHRYVSQLLRRDATASCRNGCLLCRRPLLWRRFDKIVTRITRIRDPISQSHDALTPDASACEGRGHQSYMCQLTALHNVTNTTRLHL